MTRNFLICLFVPFALGNVLGAFYRTVMAVLAPDLIDDLGLGAEDLGLLTSIYFLVFAAAQLPLGLLLDRYGARRVLAALFVIAGVGCATFALGQSMAVLGIGRALMGLGMSVALMGAFKAMVDWLPREKVAFGNGIILMAGGVGSMCATIPVQASLAYTDWRGVFLALGAVTLGVSAIVYWMAPDKKHDGSARSMTDALRGLRDVCFDRSFILNAPLGGITMGVAMSVTNLWSGPWLRDVVGVPRAEISHILFAMAAMMTISVFLSGAIVERLQRKGIPMIVTACAGIVCFIALQTTIVLDPTIDPYFLWLPLAFFGTSPVLIYTVLTQSFAPSLAGRVNTAYNFVVFVFGFGAQWAIGAIIDLWPPIAEGRFAPDGYRTALAIMIGFEIAAFAWLIAANRVSARKLPA